MKIQIHKDMIEFNNEKNSLTLTNFLFYSDFHDKEKNKYAFQLYVFPEYLNPAKNKNWIVFHKNKGKKRFTK